MSNPYDPYNSGNQGNQGQPGDPNAYGQPQPYGSGGYGSDPYGTPQGYGQSGFGMATKTDAVSITGFILSLTCCLSIVGAILGFIGLGRTKDNQRKGRWAAISASIIGVIGTLAFAGGVIFLVWFAKSVVSVEDAEVGQCVQIDDSDDDAILLRDADCAKNHDGEIVYKGEYKEISGTNLMPDDINDLANAAISYAVCTQLMPEADVNAVNDVLGEDAEYTFALDETKDPDPDEPFICFVQHSDGDSIDEQILQ